MFWQNLKGYLANYFRFKGKATRQQFWHPFLAIIVLQLFLAWFVPDRYYVAFYLLTFIPTMTLTARRLHDASLSWRWLVLIYLLRLPFSACLLYFTLFNDHSYFDFTVIFGLWLITYLPLALVGCLPRKDPISKKEANRYLMFASLVADINLLGLVGLSLIYAVQDKKLVVWYYYTLITLLVILLIGLVCYVCHKYRVFFQNVKEISNRRRIALKLVLFFNLLVYLIAWGFYGSAIIKRLNEINSVSHSQVVITVQARLNHDYHQAGFKGKVIVKSKDISHDEAECNDDYIVPYVYQEKVNGRTYQVNGYVYADPVSLKYDKFINRKMEVYNFRGDAIGYEAITGQAPYFQPNVQKQFKYANKQFQKLVGKEQEAKPIYGGIVCARDSKAFKRIVKTVRNNRKQNKPINGFYNLNIKQLAKQGTVEFYLTLHQKNKWNDNQYIIIEKRLRKLRLKKLYDAKYNVYFDYGKANTPDDKLFTFKVKKGKVRQLKLKTSA